MMHFTLLDDDAIDLPPMPETYQTINTKDGAIAASALTDQALGCDFKLLDREDLKRWSDFYVAARAHGKYWRSDENFERWGA